MTDWIKLSLVADAYDLTLDRCAELAQHVACAYDQKPEQKSSLPFDPELHPLPEGIDKGEWVDDDRERANLGARLILDEDQSIKKTMGQFEGRTIDPLVASALFSLVKVDKAEAVRFLELNVRSMQNEVDGLTRRFVDSILASAPGAALTADSSPEAQNMPTTTTTEQSSMAQGGSRPETNKIKATNEACIKIADSIQCHLDSSGKAEADHYARARIVKAEARQ
ncbi:MAG: hypothetical protein FWG17_04755 [Desulfovibrionaceae bacterium]|nr:hypothetical protein [Desulfovibrionaceae bacterium]